MATMGDWMAQSFFFDWTPSTYPTPVPITAQCETIQIEWNRGTATGPDPVAPYFLEIYTSHYIFPFQIPVGSQLSANLTIPFAPGTQYQICMFDSVGNTGGCQAVYTVYAPNVNSSMEGQCANFTFPQTTLQVDSSAGQYAWVPSCTDLTLRPTSGTPPYQVTIAPALHPPRNFSNVGSDGVTWQVDLQWAMPFFVGMTDSSGLSWSFGPLHAGQGSEDCFVKSDQGLGVGGAVGVAMGSLILGAVLMLGIFHFYGHRLRSNYKDHDTDSGAPLRPYRGGESSLAPTPYLEQEPEQSRGLMGSTSQDFLGGLGYQSAAMKKQPSTSTTTSGGYQIEPFDPESVRPEPSSPEMSRAGTAGSRSSQVYVVHHDAGPPPVSIYTHDGTQVVELPPAYRGAPGSNSASSGPPTSTTPSRGVHALPPGAATPGFIPPSTSGRQISSSGGRSEKVRSRPATSNPDNE